MQTSPIHRAKTFLWKLRHCDSWLLRWPDNNSVPVGRLLLLFFVSLKKKLNKNQKYPRKLRESFIFCVSLCAQIETIQTDYNTSFPSSSFCSLFLQLWQLVRSLRTFLSLTGPFIFAAIVVVESRFLGHSVDRTRLSLVHSMRLRFALWESLPETPKID